MSADYDDRYCRMCRCVPDLCHCYDNKTAISLRDHFAGQAIAGLCARADFADTPMNKLAEVAYVQADAMLDVREI